MCKFGGGGERRFSHPWLFATFRTSLYVIDSLREFAF